MCMGCACRVHVEKHRIHLELDTDAKLALDRVKRMTRAETVALVLRRALSLYDLVTQFKKEGGELVFRAKDGKESILRIL